jgi:hypothetical protein
VAGKFVSIQGAPGSLWGKNNQIVFALERIQTPISFGLATPFREISGLGFRKKCALWDYVCFDNWPETEHTKSWNRMQTKNPLQQVLRSLVGAAY